MFNFTECYLLPYYKIFIDKIGVSKREKNENFSTDKYAIQINLIIIKFLTICYQI